MLSKKEVRKGMKSRRAALSKEYRHHFVQLLELNLLPFCLDLGPKTIHTFISFNDEPNLLPLLDRFIEKNIQIVAPKTLKSGKMEHFVYTGRSCIAFGLYQTPFPNTKNIFKGNYSIILVPGLAFDKTGKRLGYGGGYYDRFLADNVKALKIGIVYPFQVLESIPLEPHDQAVDYLFTGEVSSTNVP